MRITYNNLYTHFIFTTRKREPLILEKHRNRIEKYVTGIIQNNASKLYAIYANPEHMHFLVSRSPAISEEQLASVIAESSEQFINENKFTRSPFSWQLTASAFSVSKSDVKKVCSYILNQPKHHKIVTFEEEYKRFIEYYQQTIARQ